MKHSINLNYWNRSTGPTGQCLGTEINQDLYAECANLHKMVTGDHLSKMALYGIALDHARDVKRDNPMAQIQHTASAIMGVMLVELRSYLRTQKRRKRPVLEVTDVFETLSVSNLRELSCQQRGPVTRVKIVNG